MISNRACMTSLAPDETERIALLIADARHKDNPLLADLRQLHEVYVTQSQRIDRLLTEKSYLESQLVNLTRSLDLATRIDPMTGLANRRAIMEKLDQEFSRAHRHHHQASIILADLDDFGVINDRYGYNTGDDVLVEVARVLRGCLRSEDICARWGGEEFLILLPETGLEGAAAVAAKIRESIAMTIFSANRAGIELTISLGVCSYQPEQDIFTAVKQADHALQQAKQAGKNRALVVP